MQIQRVNKTDAEKVYAQAYNSILTTVSAGYLVCWHVRTTASANGLDIEKPVTSALPAFAGVAFDILTTTGDTRYGRVQVYGAGNAFVSASGGETLMFGQVVGPITGIWSANSAGASTQLGPIIILSERAGGNALNPVFIRAL